MGCGRSESLSDASDRAWAMRDAFDGVLSAVEEHGSLHRQAHRGCRLPRGRCRCTRPACSATLPLSSRAHRSYDLLRYLRSGRRFTTKASSEARFRIYETAIFELGVPCRQPGRTQGTGRRLAETERRELAIKPGRFRAFDGMLDVIARGRLN